MLRNKVKLDLKMKCIKKSTKHAETAQEICDLSRTRITSKQGQEQIDNNAVIKTGRIRR